MRLTLFTLAAALVLGAQAETFTIDTSHADISFAAKHMMVSNTKGAFNTFSGTLEYDIASGTLESAQGVIEAASIDTNNKKRDDHLRNNDYFNVTKFPKIKFRSTSVKKLSKNQFQVTGLLNMLGVDRKVVLPVTINGPIDGRSGGKVIGVECETKLNRQKLGITGSPSSVIGDEVKVSIQLEAVAK